MMPAKRQNTSAAVKGALELGSSSLSNLVFRKHITRDGAKMGGVERHEFREHQAMGFRRDHSKRPLSALLSSVSDRRAAATRAANSALASLNAELIAGALPIFN
jgi:hypothetical protein